MGADCAVRIAGRWVALLGLCAVLAAAPVNPRPLVASIALSVANSSTNAFIAAFIGALLGELLGKHVSQKTAQQELAAEEELRRQQLTERDESGLKTIATAIEEYRVDNGGAYPKSLTDLSPTYLRAGSRIIPGSDPVTEYVYEHPASDPNFGDYDVKDNGAFDPTLDRLVNARDRSICTRQTCKYIIYAQGFGLAGVP